MSGSSLWLSVNIPHPKPDFDPKIYSYETTRTAVLLSHKKKRVFFSYVKLCITTYALFVAIPGIRIMLDDK